MDQTFWKAIVQADYAVPQGHDPVALLPELLSCLGSPDPVWRDEIAYMVLAWWQDRGVFDTETQRQIGHQCAANLKVGIGEQGTDSVFLRTFSALILGNVIEYDTKHQGYLTEAEVHGWLEDALTYFEQERDLRGYTPGGGWAHSVAHTADLLMMLAANSHLGQSDLERILDAIAAKLRLPVPQTYRYDEDERLACTAREVLQRDLLTLAALRAWLTRLVEFNWGEAYRQEGTICAYINVRDFVRSLYLQLTLGAQEKPAITTELLPVLQEALSLLDIGFYKN